MVQRARIIRNKEKRLYGEFRRKVFFKKISKYKSLHLVLVSSPLAPALILKFQPGSTLKSTQ